MLWLPAICRGADSDVAADPAVTPYRPSVSTPAALSAPGWLEVEAGLLGADLSPGHRTSLPYTLKLAVTPDWGLRVGGEAWVNATDGLRATDAGLGDTSITLKRRWAMNDRSALGLELGGTFATARAGLGSGSGSTDFSLNAIYSTDAGRIHADLNLAWTRFAHVAADEGRLQTLWAAALSTNLGPAWSTVAELSGTTQPGADATLQVLWAASYSPRRSLTLDGGVARGLRSAAPGWSVFMGATMRVARLF